MTGPNDPRDPPDPTTFQVPLPIANDTTIPPPPGEVGHNFTLEGEFGHVEIPTERPPAAIPAGRAQEALDAAWHDLVHALDFYAATATACARALDAMATTEAP